MEKLFNGKWGLNEKHFQTLINKRKNIDFFLQN